MVIRYSPDPDSYFTLIDYCLKAGIGDAEYRCERPWKTGSGQQGLFSCAEGLVAYGSTEIRLRPDRARVEALRSELARLAPFSEQDILFAFLSEEPIEACIVAYADKALSGRADLLRDETDPAIRTVMRAARRVGREIHAFQGLLRFEEKHAGMFEAVFEPDNDIAFVLHAFFQRRFGSLPFSIVDEKRSRRVGSNGPEASDRPLSDDEWKALWRVFYDAAENPQRHNPKLRLQHAPKRYWKHLPELNRE